MNHPGAREPETWPDDLPEPTGGFVWRQVPWGVALACPPLDPWARHLFTTRELSPGVGVEPDDEWVRVAAYLDLPVASLVRMAQVHGCATLRARGASESLGAASLPSADAAVSSSRDVGLVVKTADCVPILLADSHGRGVGAVHAGWRGTAHAIARVAVEALTAETGGSASEIVAAIGPSIGACCYEVGPEVYDGFAARVGAGASDGLAFDSWFRPAAGDRLQLDLWRANRDQLVAAGLPWSSIHVAGLCTACHLEQFFSYRREGARAGRLLAAVRKH